jgi:hypothetical protein
MTMEYQEGYNIIIAEANEDRGMAKVAALLVTKMRELYEVWDVHLIGNAKIDDDQSAGKNMYIAYQCVMLKRKTK